MKSLLGLAIVLSLAGCKDSEIDTAKEAKEAISEGAVELGKKAVEKAKAGNELLLEQRAKLEKKLTSAISEVDSLTQEEQKLAKELVSAKTQEAKEAAQAGLDAIRPKLKAANDKVQELRKDVESALRSASE